MSDIIFNGTELRRPLSMAEVSLTICDVDREQLRAANLDLLFNEVTITRRIYRDGNNEYFLNKTPCRLKDIQQLFLGTGVGRTSYSILAQGHITQILSSRPEDRRMIFEEAAGITRFKVQKKEALRKLDQTETNLLRLTDTIREIKRQIGSLQRQAGKARHYKTLSTDLRFLETQQNRHLYDTTSEELTARTEESTALDGAIKQANLDIQVQEEQINQSRQQAEELDQNIATKQKQGLETHSQIESLNSNIAFSQERIQESNARSAKANKEIQHAAEKKVTAQQDLQQLTQTIASTQQELDGARQTLRDRTEALQSVDATLVAKQSALRNVQNQLFNVTQKLSRARNEINTLDIQKQGNVVRLEKLNSEIAQNREEIQRLEKQIQEFNQTAETDKQVSVEKKAQLQQLQTELNQLQTESSALNRKQDDLYRQIATRKSRLNVLEQLQSSREGFGAGAQAILKGQNNAAKGVLGALIDRIRIPSEYVNPVETLLGTRLQLILAEKPENAQTILSELKNSKKGIASIAPLHWATETVAPEEKASPSFEGLAEKPIRILDIIQAEESVLTLLSRLMGNAWIVSSLEIASTLWSQHPNTYEFVSTNGDILTKDGIFVGGSRKEMPQSSSILERKNEIAALKVEVEKLENDVTQLKASREAIATKQRETQENSIRLQSEIRTHEVAVATRLGEFRALDNTLRIQKRKDETLTHEMTLLTARDGESTTRRQLLSDQIVVAEQEEKGHSDNITEINTSIDGLRQQRDTAQNALTEVKINLASKEQFYNTQRLQKNAAENRIAELTRTIETRTKEINEVTQKVHVCNEEISAAKLRIDFLTAEYTQINQQIAELTQQKTGLATEIEGRDNTLKSLRRQLQLDQEKHAALNVQIAQRQMSIQNISQRMQEKYQLDILSILLEPFRIEQKDDSVKIERLSEKETGTNKKISEETVPATETTSPEAATEPSSTEETFQETGAETTATEPDVETAQEEVIATDFPPIDWELVGSIVTKLQERIDQLGPVNLVAIEEYEEIEARHKFLTEQQDDMVKAKAQLLDVVSKINQETKTMFTATFEEIRRNFRSMFATFFHGGTADLKLVDERDVLESGIEIMARPPGKQPKSVSLLSGGEQTMTAVALLFAIYQVRPSPFCVLDELDATLDEANVDRFVTVLKQFVNYSQFIVITHSKRTISAANSIHGVTMPEKGVTKMISMKFKEGTDQLEKQEE